MGHRLFFAASRHVRGRASGPRRKSAWCSRATAWASSRFISRGAAKISCSAPNSRPSSFIPKFDRRLDPAALDCYLSLNYVPCPFTMVEGIEKLPPGQFLEWRDGRIRTDVVLDAARAARWQPNPRIRSGRARFAPPASPCASICSRTFPWAYGSAAEWIRPRSLHYAANASPSKLKTLSISFRGRTFDESSYIREVASQYGSDHEQFDLNPDVNLQDAIGEFSQYADEPNADAGALPVWFLSKMSKTKVTVTLSGEGADELFGGYLTYRANVLARKARRLPSPALRLRARRHPASACLGRKDQLRIQGAALSRRLFDGPRARPRVLERHFFGCRQVRPRERATPRHARSDPRGIEEGIFGR